MNCEQKSLTASKEGPTVRETTSLFDFSAFPSFFPSVHDLINVGVAGRIRAVHGVIKCEFLGATLDHVIPF